MRGVKPRKKAVEKTGAGFGHDQWLHIRVIRVYEKSKNILWFTEHFADVVYQSGLTGSLPLDTGDIYRDARDP